MPAFDIAKLERSLKNERIFCNEQAYEAAKVAQEEAARAKIASKVLSNWEYAHPYRTGDDFRTRLANKAAAVATAARTFEVSGGVFSYFAFQNGGLKAAIDSLYIECFDMYAEIDAQTDRSDIGGIVDGMVEDLQDRLFKAGERYQGMGILEAAGAVAGDVLTDAGKGAGNIGTGAKNALGSIVGSIWPVLAIVGVLAVGGIVVYAWAGKKVG